MKHKKILFDQIREENQFKNPQKSNGKIFLYNSVMTIFSGIAKVLVIFIVSVVGSLVLTVLITAVFQHKDMMQVAIEFIDKGKSYFT